VLKDYGLMTTVGLRLVDQPAHSPKGHGSAGGVTRRVLHAHPGKGGTDPVVSLGKIDSHRRM
jgi:hypothetical protein